MQSTLVQSTDVPRPPFKPTVARRGLVLFLVPFVLASACLFTLNQLWLSTCHLSSVMQAQNEVFFDLTVNFSDLHIYCYNHMPVAFRNTPGPLVRARADREPLLRRFAELSAQIPSQQNADLLRTGAAFCAIVSDVE